MIVPVTQQQQKFSDREDGSVLKILIQAAESWISSGSADVDVDATDARSRGLLYEIGNDFEYQEDMSASKTFVRTGKNGHKDLAKCATRLLCFLYRQK